MRWISAAFFILFVGSVLIFFPREARKRDRIVRSATPLSFVTGPLWASILFVVFLSLLAEAVLPSWVYGGPLTLTFAFDSILQGLGTVAWLIGGGLAIWAQRHLGRYTRPQIEVLVDHRLVSEGPYARIRHPLYTAFLMMSAGVALLLLNVVLMVLFLVACGIARRRAHLEEELLASEGGFGMEYRTYMKHTGRFFPRIRTTERREAADHEPR